MNERYTILKPNGDPGASWTCDDRAEALAIADEHGYTIEDVIGTGTGGFYLVVQPELPAPASTEWDGYPSQRDLVAAMLYNARANSPREMTPERWATITTRFPSTARVCLEDADREIDNLDG